MSDIFDINIEKILNKKFNKKIYAGYDPEDVDQFFDDVIKYIKDMQGAVTKIFEKYKKLNDENDSYKKIIKEKDDSINTLNEQLAALYKEGYGQAHMNKKVNELEKQVSQMQGEKKK